MIRGEAARVRIRFDATVARYVQRRQWHPTQRFRRVEGGIEMTMDVRGKTELVSWVLGFGDTARIEAPFSVVSEVEQALRRGLATYQGTR